MLGALTFQTPTGLLVAFAVLLPLCALVSVGRRQRRMRELLGLSPAERPRGIELASVVAVPLLLALAASGPALVRSEGHPVRADTQAIFVFDVSRSMAAAAGPRAPTRLDQAEAAAIQLRDGFPDVPAGVSSLTTVLLPELFPTPDEASFAETIGGSLAILKPPPPAFEPIATSFAPLGALDSQGFFAPATRHRVVVLLTDGESGPFDARGVALGLSSTTGPGPSFEPVPRQARARVNLIIIRFGSSIDRIYRPGGGVDPGYRPQLGVAQLVAELAKATDGRAYDARQLGAARRAIRVALGTGPDTRAQIHQPRTTRLAPYIALAAFMPLGLLVWRRNLAIL